ncbi:hypothetical protein AB0L06_36480 [Spirillospora sp. NPDC052269]
MEDDELWTTVRKPEATGPSVTRRDTAPPDADEAPAVPGPTTSPALPPSEVSPPSLGADSTPEPSDASEPVAASEDVWTPAPAGGRHRSPEPVAERPSGQPGTHRNPMDDNAFPDDHPTPEPEPIEEADRRFDHDLTPPPLPHEAPEPPSRPSQTRPDITAPDREPPHVREPARDRETPRDRGSVGGREAVDVRETVRDREPTDVRETVGVREPTDVRETVGDREPTDVRETARDRGSVGDREPADVRETPRVREPARDRETVRDGGTVRDRGSVDVRETVRDRGTADSLPWRERRSRSAGPAEDMSRLDARARRALVDEFVGAFVGGPTWQALLVVLEGAFPGLGVGATLATSADEIWREIAPLDERGAVARIGIPLWLGPSGLEVDLSAHWHSTAANGRRPRPRASRPYRQALVVDTIDPLRYHRPVSGPSSPHDRPFEAGSFDLETDFPTPASDVLEGAPPADSARFGPAFDQPGEDDRGRAHGDDEDDTGVVIVADLTAAGVRVLDAAAVWRFASRIIADTLRDPRRPESRQRARRTLRSLRRVVMVDPRLGLGLCLGLDDRHTPRCLLVFRVERTEVAIPRFVRP